MAHLYNANTKPPLKDAAYANLLKGKKTSIMLSAKEQAIKKFNDKGKPKRGLSLGW